MHYLVALDHLHELLHPANYVEIGCRHGASLSRARCPALAIDPDFQIRRSLEAPTRIFRQTSDDFFAKQDLSGLLGGPVDMAFIDGMHQAEYALRDFINLEAHAHPGAVIAIDDILPGDISWTTRERQTEAWTGDIYKLIPLLRAERPDLTIEVFDIKMKGLAVIHNLDPANRSLAEALPRHEAFLAGSASEIGSVEEIRQHLAPRPVTELRGHVAQLAKARTERAGAERTRAEKTGAENTRAADLYLDLLKRSLLNEIYLDDELRLLYLRDCLTGGDSFDYPTYHDIRNTRRDAYEAMQARRAVGQFPERDIHRSGFSHTMMGRKRIDSLHDCLDDLRARDIPGDLVECGVWRGGGCIFMAGYLRAHGMTGRRVLVADSFEGLPVPTADADAGLDLSKVRFPELAVSQETVRENFAVNGLLSDDVVFLKGWFKDSLPGAPTERIALLRMDGDLYESTLDTLAALYDRVVPGGVVVVDDYGALKACRKAVADFFKARGETVPPLSRIDWTGAWFTKPVTQAAPATSGADAVL